MARKKPVPIFPGLMSNLASKFVRRSTRVPGRQTSSSPAFDRQSSPEFAGFPDRSPSPKSTSPLVDTIEVNDHVSASGDDSDSALSSSVASDTGIDAVAEEDGEQEVEEKTQAKPTRNITKKAPKKPVKRPSTGRPPGRPPNKTKTGRVSKVVKKKKEKKEKKLPVLRAWHKAFVQDLDPSATPEPAVAPKRTSSKLENLRRNALKDALDASSQEPKTVESIDDILARDPPADELEYVSFATERSNPQVWAPLIGGVTAEEKARIEQELFDAGILDIPDKYHPEYLKTKNEDPGNFNKILFYDGVPPKRKLAIAGVPKDPLVIDPPGSGTPFDALKFPDRLVAQLNRDDEETLYGWDTKALKQIPKELLMRLEPDTLAKLPNEVLSRQPSEVLDNLPSDATFFSKLPSNSKLKRPEHRSAYLKKQNASETKVNQPLEARASRGTSNGPSNIQSSSQSKNDDGAGLRGDHGQFLTAPARGQGGKFLPKVRAAGIEPEIPLWAMSANNKPARSRKPTGKALSGAATLNIGSSSRRRSGNTFLSDPMTAKAASDQAQDKGKGKERVMELQWTDQPSSAATSKPKAFSRRRSGDNFLADPMTAKAASDQAQNKGKERAIELMWPDQSKELGDSSSDELMDDAFPRRGSGSAFLPDPMTVKAASDQMQDKGEDQVIELKWPEPPKGLGLSSSDEFWNDQCFTCATMGMECNGERPECLWCRMTEAHCSFLAESPGDTGFLYPDPDPGRAPGLQLNLLPVATEFQAYFLPDLQEESFSSRPSIRITIPDHLKGLLVDDWENVTKSLLLVPLPSQAPANFIIDSYYNEEKMNRRLGSAEADVLEEFAAGMKVYFEKSVGKILLYRFERSQLADVSSMPQFLDHY